MSSVSVQCYISVYYHQNCEEIFNDIEAIDPKHTWEVMVGSQDHKFKPQNYIITNRHMKDKDFLKPEQVGKVQELTTETSPYPVVKYLNSKQAGNGVYACYNTGDVEKVESREELVDGRIVHVALKNMAQANHKCQRQCCTIL